MTPNVRTFRAPDPAAALAAVKAALGADAVILSTRTVDGGLFRKPEIEITAAVEHPAPPPARKRPAVRPRPEAPPAPRPELNVAPRPAAPPPRPPDDELQDEIRYLRKSVQD